ncbi:helix-turn-helix domain-containing protein [Adhaeribacter pallidiroseus]|uniref:HTH araC/xylS-type domain-containing protein n=1 Tax=Adhaeribacter pallidiroseus TaxID=2072847 RepID=A0A369QKS4_9BACT|nr:AraC family transcriptional regulator [Adhaeribacter pallidiroseus]RDC63449.1 hypothetical protein AHMF7616_02052 [Adhaeribacter pallidiroseus]
MTYQLFLTLGNIMLLIGMVASAFLSSLLILARSIKQPSIQFLTFFLLTISFWLFGIIVKDVTLGLYYPILNWLPFNFTLTLGPSVFFYVKSVCYPEWKSSKKDYLHYLPLIIHVTAQTFYIWEGYTDGVQQPNLTNIYEIINPVVELLTTSSIIVYIALSLKEINLFQIELNLHFSNAGKYKLDWLIKDLRAFAVMWVLWVPFTLYDYLLNNYELPATHYYTVYFLIAATAIWMGIETLLRPALTVDLPPQPNYEKQPDKEQPNAIPLPELVEKSEWLNREITRGQQYLNPELTLRMLAVELDIHHNTLTRIINQGAGKNFSDYINEYRINEVKRKAMNSSYNHLTLEGIAYECGFNSKSTFIRSFKKLAGMPPAAYLKKLKESETGVKMHNASFG